MSEDQTTPIRAAGGIVKGVGRNTGKIAIVVRKRYRDNAGKYERGLPKGKLKGDESDIQAALREVEEETGVRATSGKFLSSRQYEVNGRPKTVSYFLMEAPDDLHMRPKDSSEIEEVKWLTPTEAIVALTHEDDRKLIQSLSGNVLRERRGIWRLVAGWFGSPPERARLDGAINDALIDLSQASMQARGSSWWQGADRHLAQAQKYLADGNLQQGWCSLGSANRMTFLDKSDPERVRSAATKLLNEAGKLSGWRSRAVVALISDDKGKTLANDVVNDPMRLVQALAIRDDQFETNYFKIALRRQHLIRLAAMLVICIAVALALSRRGHFPDPFNNFWLMVCVVLFGTLGGALSVARGLLKTDVSAKIPAQQIGAFVIWMRPAIGAAAALISFVLLHASGFHIFGGNVNDPTVVLTIATVSGFSERFIVGAIEKIGNDKDGGDSKD